jgi:phosphoribosyl 1,2-cyclic phosphodiesterase
MQFKKDKSIWENYTKEHTYQNLEYQNKKKFVTEFVKRIKPDATFLTHLSHFIGKHEDLQSELPEGVYVGYDNLVLENV